MMYKELNEYIRHYIEHDRTHSAIMLTAPWGAGKSYYIQHELIPFLQKEENGNHQCIVVSLYGLNTLFEISKAIYMESRIKVLTTNISEKAEIGILTAKTIVKGITSFLGIDLSKTPKEMGKLYKSINLSGKLIILEDIERSEVDVVRVLGYVNNLVEQDGVKVLLVANEAELIQYTPKTGDSQDNENTFANAKESKSKEYTDATQKYLMIKEKTVSDTVLFESDYPSAIKQIISEFDEDYFRCFSSKKEFTDLLQLLSECNIYNLRTFIYACQKANDIYSFLKLDVANEIDYIKTILYSILIFSQRIKTGKNTTWDSTGNISTALSSEEYPLLRFCYDYIMWQILDPKTAEFSKKAFDNYRDYDKKKSRNDNDLQTLYSWWIHSEKDVRDAIQAIENKLQNKGNLSYYEYGRIAVNIVLIKRIIGCNIEGIKKLLINNLHNEGQHLDIDYVFIYGLFEEDSDPEVFKEYRQLREDMIESAFPRETTIYGFDYQPKSIISLKENVTKNDGVIFRDRTFATKMDPDKIAEMLKKSSAEDIQNFRSVFISVYSSVNIKDYFSNDKESIERIKTKIQGIGQYDGFDRIQKHQIRLFINNLDEIIAKL